MTTHKKTVALFGAGSGLRESLAKWFGRKGFQVVLGARDAAALATRMDKARSRIVDPLESVFGSSIGEARC